LQSNVTFPSESVFVAIVVVSFVGVQSRPLGQREGHFLHPREVVASGAQQQHFDGAPRSGDEGVGFKTVVVVFGVTMSDISRVFRFISVQTKAITAREATHRNRATVEQNRLFGRELCQPGLDHLPLFEGKAMQTPIEPTFRE